MKTAFSSLGPWALGALVMAVAPRVFSSDFALTMMSVMGVMIIFALSYNMLLGQTGLLSFGHAVYFGLGGFVAIHVDIARRRQCPAGPHRSGRLSGVLQLAHTSDE